jgi:hypothetical protein
MNPISPSSTTSGNAPERKATTGVPELRASIATSELVSATKLESRQLVPLPEERFSLPGCPLSNKIS